MSVLCIDVSIRLGSSTSLGSLAIDLGYWSAPTCSSDLSPLFLDQTCAHSGADRVRRSRRPAVHRCDPLTLNPGSRALSPLSREPAPNRPAPSRGARRRPRKQQA